MAGRLDAGRFSNIFMRKVILIVLLLGGCKDVPMLPNLTPYKIDIQQGNYVTQDMVAKLKLGMTRSQVRFILGTPLVVDPFRNDRWDYVYLYKKGGEVTEQRRFAVLFRDDKLTRLEGDIVPASPDRTGRDVAVEKPKPAAAAPIPEVVAPHKAVPKPEVAAPAATAPATSTLTTTSGEPVQSALQKAEPTNAESGTEKLKEEQPQEDKGFFGRMLERLGF